MAYIGRQLVRGQNRVLDDISGSFNGSTTAFNLTVSSSSSPPASVNQLWIILGGILQKPGTDFTVADAVLTFTTAPASTLSFWGMIQGDTSDINSPADASVTPSKIANSGDFAFPADVRFNDADGSHYVGLQAPSTVSSNLVWSLPAADGSANQLLKTDGSGNLGWASDTQSNLLDEDNMSSNSATQPASQQSIKAYADTKAVLTGSTDNTVCTVTGANAISGESNLIFDGTNLGIGCTPSRELHVKGLDGTIRLESTAATGRTWIEFFDTSAIKGSIGYPSSANDNLAIQQTENADMYFTTNDTERFRIAAGGDAKFVNSLGVGNVDSGGATLNVNGNISVSAGGNTSWSKITLSGSGGSSGDDLSINNWGDAEGDYWSIGVNSTANQSGSHAKTNDAKRSVGVLLDGRMGRLVLQTSQTSTATIDTTHTWDRGGDYTLTGNVVIGTAGKGIDFSATAHQSGMSSELLDTYEEGTFTPKMGGITNHGSYEIAGFATYTKIGRWVHCEVAIHNQNIDDNAAGQVILKNLPFSPYTGSNGGHAPRGISSNFMLHNVELPTSGDNNIYSMYMGSDGMMYGMRTNDGGAWSSWDVSNFHAGTMYFDFTFSYTASS